MPGNSSAFKQPNVLITSAVGRVIRYLSAATAIVAVVVGFALAFFGITPERQPVLFWIWVAVVGVMFIAFLVVPTLKMLTQRGGHREASES